MYLDESDYKSASHFDTDFADHLMHIESLTVLIDLAEEDGTAFVSSSNGQEPLRVCLVARNAT